MTKRNITDVAASIKQKLLNIIRESGIDAHLIWTRFANERFLYRLSKSKHADRFVLKGAALIATWIPGTFRPTRDIDLLGFGNISEASLVKIIRDILTAKVEPDGLQFDPESIKLTPLLAGDIYHGQRVMFMCYLGKAKFSLQIDIGLGGPIVPDAKDIIFPTILDLPAPHIPAYQPETVIAEKFNAIVKLGMQNSRMKDYFDIMMLTEHFDFEGDILLKSIQNTFNRSEIELPMDLPIGLSEEFTSNANKNIQWKAFLEKSGLEDKAPALEETVTRLNMFFKPLLKELQESAYSKLKWKHPGPWKEQK